MIQEKLKQLESQIKKHAMMKVSHSVRIDNPYAFYKQQMFLLQYFTVMHTHTKQNTSDPIVNCKIFFASDQ